MSSMKERVSWLEFQVGELRERFIEELNSCLRRAELAEANSMATFERMAAMAKKSNMGPTNWTSGDPLLKPTKPKSGAPRQPGASLVPKKKFRKVKTSGR